MEIIRSELVNYIFDKAEKLAKADGRSVATANYFIMAVISVATETESEKFPTGIDVAKATAELDGAVEALKTLRDDLTAVYNDIHNAITKSGYRSTLDELAYGKIKHSLDGKAEAQQKRVVDLEFVMSQILEEPSDAIRRYVTEYKDVKDVTAGTDEILNKLRALLGGEDEIAPETEKAATEAAEAVAEAAAEGNKEGLGRLIKTIADTRAVQNTLLETVYGQDQAINTFVSGFFQAELMAFSRKENKKPQATFLFAGPPGVGKTFLAETVAKALGRPYKRVDMSEYCEKESNLMFCGSDKVYKNGSEGEVTGFVAKNPRCVLLFDEIEKAHINVIYLFLQLLDAGRLRDNFTDEEVSFKDAVLIFTTNVGKKLYNDPDIANLSALPKKTVLKALAAENNPVTGEPLFPGAICSRFASGNVVMFNHLGANNLYTIANRELAKNVKGFVESTGISVDINDRVATAIMFSEGGKADARTVSGRANSFFHEELYELFRLLASDSEALEKVKRINVDIDLTDAGEAVTGMFVNNRVPEVLIFAEDTMAKECEDKLEGLVCHSTDSLEEAKEILFNYDISIVLCDIKCKIKNPEVEYLNAEDVSSVGQDFLSYLLLRYSIPAFLIEGSEGDISAEEFLSFAKRGVRDVLNVGADKEEFCEQVLNKCDIAYQQGNMLKLARGNRLLTYKTAQTISADKTEAAIRLFDFKLGISADADDKKGMLDGISKPGIRFADVIGAKDAKGELAYFIQYLKDPVKYMRKGVRSPRGILLYGPPGTGKTMLAKAMAGESDVTFIATEGNKFVKKYVGDAAEAVHDIFATARKYAPSILFIDEIESIAKARGSNTDSYNAAEAVTALLTEMDGFTSDTSKPVFVLAATNYEVRQGTAKSLDPAILRRFDRKIYVDLPNKEERKEYLKMKISRHADTVKLSEEQIDNIALRSTGMSLADLESMFEMALRNAIRSENGVISDAEFEEAFETFNSGDKKEWNPETLTRTARHEAGHALLCKLGGEMPSYLTIVARASHGGYMQHGDTENKGVYTKKELLARIRTALGGRAAELVYYGEEDGVSTGASGDLATATYVAENMICAYGMDEASGLSCVSNSEKGSPSFAPVRTRVNEILGEEMEKTVKLILEHKCVIDKLVEELLEKNHLKENDMARIFDECGIE